LIELAYQLKEQNKVVASICATFLEYNQSARILVHVTRSLAFLYIGNMILGDPNFMKYETYENFENVPIKHLILKTNFKKEFYGLKLETF